MPYSYTKYKDQIKDHLLTEFQHYENPRILDVGAGAGTYSDLLKLPMDACEIYEPYIHQFNLYSKYKNIHIKNVMDMELINYDYVILGDILEHLSEHDAKVLISKIDLYQIKCLVAVPYLYEQGEYEGNTYETHLQPDLTPEVMSSRFPSLKLIYGDKEYGYYINYTPYVAPNLIISAGRRLNYLYETLQSFTELNPNYRKMFNEVYLLDDRSTPEDRLKMDIYLSALFGDKYHIFTFNSNRFFGYVDKFNMIQHLMGDCEFVFLLEDDWKSVQPLQLEKHIKWMKQNPNVDQIMMSQNYGLQTQHIQQITNLDETYWNNPFPERYRHFHELTEEGFMVWQEVTNDNYGNNPSIYRRRVFEGKKFHNDHGWECKFADENTGRRMVLTKQHLFVHIGKDSLTAIHPKK